LLQKTAFVCLKDYEAQLAQGVDPVFHPEKLGIKNADYWIDNRAEVNLMREKTGHAFEADPDTVIK
ncbi:MAG: sodium:alanine symporter, partial [Aeromonas sp.]|nr:sodium:alanine symporter [Aeromonas sp.]